MLRAAEGSSSTPRSVLTLSGVTTLCKGMYGSWYVYVCMYVCMHLGHCKYIVFHPYLYHIGEPQREEEIDGEERDGEGGKTENMYVFMYICMYEWMDVYGWGGGRYRC
jgi:hypothetical protein